tara:strand:- start:358 stop:714 length:357 start_codon:yes stop_codon:yes gene_type:complete
MKNLFKFIVLVSVVLTLAACGRVGDLIPYEGYIPVTDVMLTNDSIKSDLEKLSDSELILMAINSKNQDKIKYAGNQSLDTETPSYQKDLANREELINVLFKSIKSNKLDSGESASSSN